MDSHKSDRQETNENNRNPLRILITILKRYFGQPVILPEVQLLKEFSLTVVPLTSLQPKMFIENMMIIHTECTTAILKNPTYLRKLVYKYNSDDKEEEYVFSNIMPLYIDVLIICFLHTMGITKDDHVQPAMKDLIAILKNKYRISDDTNTFNPLIITESKIAISFPSISIPLLCYLNNSITFRLHESITKILRKWNLSNVFGSPWLALIIPVIESEYKTPLALLLAMAVALDSINTPSYVLYQRILAFYTSEAFSSKFKLTICIFWGIIYKEEDSYKFAPYFTELREKAIELILSMKANDTSVEYTLSKI